MTTEERLAALEARQEKFGEMLGRLLKLAARRVPPPTPNAPPPPNARESATYNAELEQIQRDFAVMRRGGRAW